MISVSNVGSNYLCKVVVTKNLRKHPNADRLSVMSVDGNDVITSSSTPEGQVSIYFPLECQINEQYLSSNNEYRKTLGLNKDAENAGGFFEANGRVRAVRLRGQKSEGYLVPISTLEPLIGEDYRKLEGHIGEEFDTVEGILLARKYVVPRKEKGPSNVQPKKKRWESKLVDNQFRLHDDTAQLNKNLHRIRQSDIISITWKLHGTSFVSSRVLCKRKLNLWERFLRICGVRVSDTEYDNVYASRNVIKNEYHDKEMRKGYYGSDIWGDVNDHLKGQLHDGETVYGEIVGYTSQGRALQSGYDYKCQAGQHKIYVYKITYTTNNGKVVTLGYEALRERCEQLGVSPVPFIYHGRAESLFDHGDRGKPGTTEQWQEDFLEYLKREYVKDQPSQFCNNKVPEEGVVVVVEGLKPEAFKLKSFAFLERESKELDKGEVNIEDDVEVSADE